MPRSMLATILCATLGACGGEKERVTQPVTGDAVVSGSIYFKGDSQPTPTSRPDGNPGDEPTLFVNANGTLANVFVSVEGLPATDESTTPGPTLDQKGCHYEPHCVGVTVGQKLTIHSSDASLHNVHWAPQKNKASNYGMHEGDTAQAVFAEPEYIETRCDVHPWMRAYVGVFDNRFFAVTGPGGTFSIAGLPPGSYTVVAWQEQFGKISKPFTVDAHGNAHVDLTFEQSFK